MTTPLPPKPTPRGEERVYFDAAAENRLTYQTCDTCGSTVFYLRDVCPHCGGESLRLRDSAGVGKVYSYTVQNRASHPYFADRTPMTLALVDLEEGFRLLADLTGADDVEVGMPVEVVFRELDEDVTLPHFRPRGREEEPK
ncbi:MULTISPECIES: Zn-ribbon domain-containing OB-fold protein [unclassified Amycolatopsis]|uniref:Zn-ribbon domain-containing OB-fold protein n=1 Tax=unclassified Amycolatopsis TaxID=2618356 RepID=UPI001C696F47|nr:Zn-ribbon domain-containing OB-fold protein [Amycolatopsis sp. DSM 110486]QYN20240.1 Zn-ribbon domain-containing OB-fold protein [Amycolatopsis sp. DSM 110486]